MTKDEFLTRCSIWIALSCYFLGASLELRAGPRSICERLARWVWTAGCAVYLSHVYFAFSFYHGWSHTMAYRDTARQTGEVLGLNWGGGLYVNYLFTLAWVIDVLWRWAGLEHYRQRPRWLSVAWHTLFFIIVVNSTVVFGAGLVRWLGLAACLSLALIWWRSGQKRLQSRKDLARVTA